MAQTGGTGQKAIDAAGNLGSGAALSALTWLGTNLGTSFDPALAKLLAGGGFVVGVACALVYRRYAAIITRRGPHERRAYDALRLSLVQGGLPARVYSERLRAVLDGVDRFFGDAEMANRSLWQSAFGLHAPAPLWTAPAFDRCLLLALFYPIVVIIVVWAVSGHSGPAESALNLDQSMSEWRRGTAVGLWAFAIIMLLHWIIRTPLRKGVAWYATGFAVLGIFIGASAVSGGVVDNFNLHVFLITTSFAATGFAGAVLFGIAGNFAGAVAVATVVACAGGFVVTLAITQAVIFTVSFAAHYYSPTLWLVTFFAVPLMIAIAVALFVAYMHKRAIRRGWQGAFQVLLLLALALVCGAAAFTGSDQLVWKLISGPWLLFLGLLTLINAPFDWASLGLTRALLRRGLELGGWWPYVLALVDAACAAGIITILSIVFVLSIQLFDGLAAHSAGEGARILPLGQLLDGIEAHPAAPELWWVYAMLLSTMIPSLVNLTISGASLVRGIPWITKVLLWLMPERGAPPSFDRQWIALLLTSQVFVGAAIGVIAQGALAYLVIWWLLPPFGFGLLDLARAVAAPDLPGQAIAVIAHLF